MRHKLLIALVSAVAMLVAAAGAQAVVVDMNALGHTSVSYNSSNRHDYLGVALVPGTRGQLATGLIPTVSSNAPCVDPALSPDLTLPDNGLCSHGGNVMHSNETFALAWDPGRNYWAGTKDFVEQFLRDVANSSGSLGSPYADATQYTDGSGRAGNASKYGGACNDYGHIAGSACLFGSTGQSGAGFDYPSSGGCTPTGGSFTFAPPSTPNVTCLTDAQLKDELQSIVQETGIIGRTQPGYTPTVVLLLPPTVEACLDSAGTLCSANSDPTAVKAQFCSYHGAVSVGGTEVGYVVQPWTAQTDCDDPGVLPLQDGPTPDELATNTGMRLVGPLSQAHMAAITNPGLNAWFALDGSEVNDNGGCIPLPKTLDLVTLGQNSYFIQREFNNAGVIENDPNTYFGCVPGVLLSPTFVVPSAVNQGDTVEFDGSTTSSTLIVPNGSYQWDFGDGVTAAGPSVVHAYAKGGSYSVKLTVTDRGGNTATMEQTIEVLGPNGQPVTGSTPSGAGTGTGSGSATPGGGGTSTGSGPPSRAPSPKPTLRVRVQMLPQALRTVLRAGMTVLVSSNEAANGIAKLSISRRAAKLAHIKVGRAPSVVIGVGTVSGIRNGTVRLRVRMSHSIAGKLKRLRHVTVSIQLRLVGADHSHQTIDLAGRY